MGAITELPLCQSHPAVAEYPRFITTITLVTPPPPSLQVAVRIYHFCSLGTRNAFTNDISTLFKTKSRLETHLDICLFLEVGGRDIFPDGICVGGVVDLA